MPGKVYFFPPDPDDQDPSTAPPIVFREMNTHFKTSCLLSIFERTELMEVNSSPGLEGIEGATGVDIAGKIVEYVERNEFNHG